MIGKFHNYFKIQFNHIPTKPPYLFTNADWVIKINLFTWQVGGKGNVLFMWLFRKDDTHTSRN